MSKKDNIKECAATVNPMNSGKDIVVPATAQKVISSAANLKLLQGWSESSNYKSISFWIPPNMQPGTDECVAEVANALIKFESDKKAGLLKQTTKIIFYCK